MCVRRGDEADLLIGDARPHTSCPPWSSGGRAGEPLEYVLGWAESRATGDVEAGCVRTRRVPRSWSARRSARVASRLISRSVVGFGVRGSRRSIAGWTRPSSTPLTSSRWPHCARATSSPSEASVFEGDLYGPLRRPCAVRVMSRRQCARKNQCSTDAVPFMPPEDAIKNRMRSRRRL